MKYTYRNYKSKAKTKQKMVTQVNQLNQENLFYLQKNAKYKKKKNLLKLERNLKENIFQNITN